MEKRYDLLDKNNKLIWNFRDIGHTMRHISEGRGSQKRILIILNEESGGITQSELTRRLGIQPGSASEVLGKLEMSGLITRSLSETDKRTTDVKLTEAGRKAAIEASRQREDRHNQMFACLSDEEKDVLLSFLERINHAWDQQYRENGMQQGGKKKCGHM